jgi:cell division protein FtsL
VHDNTIHLLQLFCFIALAVIVAINQHDIRKLKARDKED